jgi:membrane associated rhomboid family serine protease
MGIHLIVIVVVVLISIIGFSNRDMMYRMQFNAWEIIHRRRYHKLFSHGLVHADWGHLLINMFVLFSFGGAFVNLFNNYLGMNGNLLFLLLFVSALPISSFYSLSKEKNNPHYNALGASGVVMAIVFACILLQPLSTIYVFILPVPAVIFGGVYLVYSKYMSGQNRDNIGHDAHFWGALYGFFFPALFNPQLLKLFFMELLSIF